MIHVFRKEFLRAILSGSFVVCLPGSVVVFALCSFLFISEYREIPGPPLTSERPSTRGIEVRKPLSPLGFCVHDAGASCWISPGTVGDVRLTAQKRNFRLPPHVRLDWAFVVVVVFGITGIVLSYSAISGEKEGGTLSLMLSYSVPRSSVFLGKYFALTAATALPLLVGALGGLLIVATMAPTGAIWGNAGRIGGFLSLSGLFVSLVVLLSLFVSAVTRRSAITALILLAIWALWTFLIPGLSRLLVSKVRPLPSELEMASRLGPMMQREVWWKINKIRKRVEAGEVTAKAEVLKLSEEAFIEGQKEIVALRRDIRRTKVAHAETSRNISRLSPAAAFRYGAEGLLNLGHVGTKRFRRDVEGYATIYDGYVVSKIGRLVTASNWAFATTIEVGEERVGIGSPRPEEYAGDMGDFPAFAPSQWPLSEALSEILLDLTILFGWNIVLFAAGSVAFIRYDVR